MIFVTATPCFAFSNFPNLGTRELEHGIFEPKKQTSQSMLFHTKTKWTKI